MRKKRTNPAKRVPKPAPTTSPAKVGSSVEVGTLKRAVGTLVPQPHGGALRPGNPGNKGGGGRPERIRERLQEILELGALPWMEFVLNATGTIPCPHCKGEVEVPTDPKLMAKLTDMALRAAVPQQREMDHKGEFILIPDTRSLSG